MGNGVNIGDEKIDLARILGDDRYKTMTADQIRFAGAWETVCGKLTGDKERENKGKILTYYYMRIKGVIR